MLAFLLLVSPSTSTNLSSRIPIITPFLPASLPATLTTTLPISIIFYLLNILLPEFINYRSSHASAAKNASKRPFRPFFCLCHAPHLIGQFSWDSFKQSPAIAASCLFVLLSLVMNACSSARHSPEYFSQAS